MCNNSVLADQNRNEESILKSASELDYPPFAIVKPDGTADGFSVDLLKAVVESVGLEVNIDVGPWHEIKQQLTEGELDVLPLVAYTPERDKLYDFTVPYLEMHGTIFVRKGETSIRTEADLNDKEVIVMRDDASHEYAVSKNIPAKLILTTSYEEAMKLLSSGKHDAVLCTNLMGVQLVNKLGIENVVSVLGHELADMRPRGKRISGFRQQFCLAVPEGRKVLLAKLNEGLAVSFANGTYDKLYKKWFDPIFPQPKVPLSRLIKPVLVVLIPILLLTAIVGIWYLRLEVKRKTRSLRLEIQERELAESSLRKSKDSLAKAQHIAKLGNWDWDITTNTLSWSDEIFHIFGMHPQNFRASYEAFLDTVHPDDRELVERSVDEALYKNKLYNIDHRIVLPDGSVGFVNEQAEVLFDNESNPIRMVGTVQDITERKQAEEEKDKLQAQLQQATKMQAVGTLAGGIAHEFNNLLGVIIGSTDMARDEISPDSYTRGHLDRAINAGFRAKDLVKQILTFSRQKFIQKPTVPLDLAASIREALDLIKPSVPSSVDININMASNCKPVLADSSEIGQVLMHLSSNAIWAMKEKGVMTISLEQIELNKPKESNILGLETGQYLLLSVSDTGQGMDSEIKERVFEPFFTTKKVGQGTGMGLSTVLGIMESYKGAITVESEPGKGTTFHLYFPTIEDEPVEDEAVVSAESKEPEHPLTGTERILFVDDEEIYCETGKDLLESLGYKVVAMSDSRKALEKFRSTPQDFDLVIADQIMPHLSGDDLTREFLVIRPDIPIILCTGYSTQIDEDKAKAIGVKEYVLKPLVKKDFAFLIRKVLDAQ